MMAKTPLFATLAALWFSAVAVGQQPKADQERLKLDIKQLDQLQKTSMSAPSFGDKFWRESKRIADERGPEIIHAIMLRSREWKGEEALIFVPLVALLPREPVHKLLKQYVKSKRDSDRLWAEEFLTELEASDTQEGVRKYSK